MHKVGKTFQPSSTNEARKSFAFFGKALFPLRKSVRQSTISSNRKDEFASVSKWLAKFWHCRFKVFKCSIFSTSIESSFTEKKICQRAYERGLSVLKVCSSVCLRFHSLFFSFLQLLINHHLSHSLQGSFFSPDSFQGYV